MVSPRVFPKELTNVGVKKYERVMSERKCLNIPLTGGGCGCLAQVSLKKLSDRGGGWRPSATPSKGVLTPLGVKAGDGLLKVGVVTP